MEVIDNCIDFYTDDKEASVTFSQQRYITRIQELAERYPDDCKIIKENDDGSIYAKIPSKWIKINPPKRANEKQLKALAENAKKKSKNN